MAWVFHRKCSEFCRFSMTGGEEGWDEVQPRSQKLLSACFSMCTLVTAHPADCVYSRRQSVHRGGREGLDTGYC